MRRDTLEFILSGFGHIGEMKCITDVSIRTIQKTYKAPHYYVSIVTPSVESLKEGTGPKYLKEASYLRVYEEDENRKLCERSIDIGSIIEITGQNGEPGTANEAANAFFHALLPKKQSEEFLKPGTIATRIRLNELSELKANRTALLNKAVKSMLEQAELSMTGLEFRRLDQTHEFIMVIRQKEPKEDDEKWVDEPKGTAKVTVSKGN